MNHKISALSLSTRVDICDIATLANYQASQGGSFRSIAEVIRVTIEVFTDHVIENTDTIPITSVDEAADILQRFALLSDQQRAEHTRRYGNALIKRGGSRKVKGRNPSTPPSLISPSSSEITPAQQAQAETILNQKLAKTLPSQVADAAARTQEFKDLLAVPAKGE